MGKVSPPSIKYVIKAKFTATGMVEKPDVIGAIFGQTEGLLGEELELRELQKKGKIGRIDAEMDVKESMTTGIVTIPTSIDKAETTLIAAAVETIDRVGPCDAKFEIEGIEDVRTSKRDFILERAKALMEKLSSGTPEIREMEQSVIDHSKTVRVREIGDEKIAAGPDVEISNEIIVVEGRADVVNLLKAGIKNAIAMNGTKIPKIVADMSKEKEVTLFVDGDRGGLLIAKNVIGSIRIKNVAVAPDGKEVEELVEKEAVACLRNKMPASEFLDKYLNSRETGDSRGYGNRDSRDRPYEDRRPTSRGTSSNEGNGERTSSRGAYYSREQPQPTAFEQVKITDSDVKEIEKLFKEIDGTKHALFAVKEGKKIEAFEKTTYAKVVTSLYGSNRRGKRIDVLIVDGTITSKLLATAEQVGVSAIAAKNFTATSEKIRLIGL